MRSYRFVAGLLAVLLASSAFSAAMAQQEDKGYLPPPAYRSRPAAAPNKRFHREGGVHPRHKPLASQQSGGRVRVARRARHHYGRHADYGPFFFFPGLFFGFFD
jgi:hypothetical protein